MSRWTVILKSPESCSLLRLSLTRYKAQLRKIGSKTTRLYYTKGLLTRAKVITKEILKFVNQSDEFHINTLNTILSLAILPIFLS